jgi:hypothetical protein
MSKEHREKAKKLMTLALGDARGGEKERITAAFEALKIIHKHDLLSSPLDGLDLEGLSGLDKETVDAAATLVKKVARGFANRGKGRRVR